VPKRLVVCCDGTWNTPDQLSGGRSAPTNVTKLALVVSPNGADGIEQRVFYHPGVGTTHSERLRGGAFGYGLSRHVRDTYRFLVANFEPGDEIFLFGFSRGAFTARSTAGLLRNSGILRTEHADRVDDAYALYRSREAHPRGVEAQLFRRSYSYETRIRFIGVWDTVGALGIPLTGLRLLNVVNHRAQFHDTTLSTTVDAAFQALAIDEKRGPFRPAIWVKQPSVDGQDRQVVEQVWFAGVHSDVGGGYADHALADVPLLWMIDNATKHGLGVDRAALLAGPFAGQPASGPGEPAPDPGAPDADPLGPLHDSRTSFYKLVPAFVRPFDRAPASCEWVSSSAVLRKEKMSDYKPDNLLAYLDGEHREKDVSPADMLAAELRR
jgi:uncharacterized protein (DUF2235 family)